MSDTPSRTIGGDLACSLSGPSQPVILADQPAHQIDCSTSRESDGAVDAKPSFGDRLADRVAAIGGSWGFIIAFSLMLVGWMLLNTDVLSHWGLSFDPYPYIFLNLLLSTLAAVQAPVIMMSQNRQAAKDRLTASLDYEVNQRTELEIQRLSEKLDCAVIARIDQITTKLEQLCQH